MGAARTDQLRIEAQPKQALFLGTEADIAIYGGSAGGGKSWALCYEGLRHIKNPDFAAVFFRRTTPQLFKAGGLWDQGKKLYRPAGALPLKQAREFQFPSGARIAMGHLEQDDTVLDHAGAQYPLIGYDELTHFTRKQFMFMLSRNRSMCGVRPYVRATCNPDSDSWVAELIAWWIDQDTGYPIPERAGRLRWFIRRGDELLWADTREELLAKYGADELPKSLTFIPARIFDNAKLMEADPGYLANLRALNAVDRARLLDGNWKIRPSAGLLFKRTWCELVSTAPADLEVVRYWDLAGTEKTPENDPDWSVGLKLGRRAVRNGWEYFVLHAERLRESPRKVRQALQATAQHDGYLVRVGIPQDPGQAGKDQAQDIIGSLPGYDVRAAIESGDKVVRFGPFSAQCEAGNVKILKGPWLDAYLTQLEAFPDAAHKDDADASSGALRMLVGEPGPDYRALTRL